MATKETLVSRVLWRLRARGSGQAPNAEDAADVAAIIDDKLADLALRKVIYIGDSDDMPDGSLDWLSRLMEIVVASAYGSQESMDDLLVAEQMLRAQQSSYEYMPIKVCYF